MKKRKYKYILTNEEIQEIYNNKPETLSTGEAYRRLARKEFEKGNKEIANRYMRKAHENGVLMRSNELYSKPVQEHIFGGKSAVKGLKMASTRIFRAVTTETKKEENSKSKYSEEVHQKVKALGIFDSAERFKNNHGTNDYRICVQRKSSDLKNSKLGSYIFASADIKCPEDLIDRHIAESYAKWMVDSSFEGLYRIDKEGNIKFYTNGMVQELLEKLKKEQEEYMNTVAA